MELDYACAAGAKTRAWVEEPEHGEHQPLVSMVSYLSWID